MSRRAGFILAIALLLVLGLIASYVLGKLEPYEDVIEHGPAPEVASSPYLAAEHFLRKQGIAARRAEGLDVLDGLPSEGQTLMLLADRGNMTPRQVERVLQWTAGGGHLLFIAERLWDEEEGKSGDLLLDLLGVQQYMSDELDDEEASEAEAENEQNEEHEAYPQLTKLYLENEQAPAYIAFDTDFHLYDAQNRAHAWANSDSATHLLQLYHGDGLITVLSDPWIWQNRNISEYDHAWLLWYLSQDSAVTLLYHADSDGLARLLLRHFPLALLVLALLIIATLWHVGMRHGPLQAPASRARRQLEEHLRGSADFLLRRSGQHSLLKGLQQDINRRARRRHPGFEKLAVAEQWQVLGRLTRLPAKDISQAMRPLPPQRLSASDFTRQVAHLQTLRNAL
ncbi:DUF4350 domain-containing protein [Pseudomonas sp. MDMC216]|jgi:hypothetical protein|uniref:DUF4350 domain-containing protein n=1 Tax=Ectopseudomonas chengduensis TaxID=489632 RepID=A0A1G6KRX2_9GAMM|nr:MULTISPECIES: DUF4350 domain-containing protein [Pseudomonas]MBP3061085.1 DUF4350 domain-containing protein [Pseudomonas chengduensis]MDH1535373.1 DUF4350 domain-containing protein [Pseudomonas chengduensis]MDI5993132.1 DUF4350 domain-containing protein [Pseudomonas sp. MDMC216]MDI6009958.1 DUF4350 domain-containing protein [Pseudomonas sp. MDMC17]NNB74166.1 DUF4350 domain-containing protein [Pseudomonas chengduensis]